MNLTAKGKTYLLIAIISFLFPILIITNNSFPSGGLFLSLLIYTIFSYSIKKQKNIETKLYFMITIMFSAFIFIRSEPFLTLLNFAAAIFFGSLMLTSGRNEKTGLVDKLTSPAIVFLRSVLTKSEYFFEKENEKSKNAGIITAENLFGLAISILILIIVIPLLASSNPFFQKIVENILTYLNIEKIFENIGIQSFILWMIRLIFFLAFLFIIPKMMSLINKYKEFSFPFSFKPDIFSLRIPKIVLSVVLTVFLITQLQFYFADQETLKNIGVTNSQHTREVFAQLSFVAAIVLLLIYNDKLRTSFDKFLSLLLGIMGIFLTFMAYKSVFEYIGNWGLTYIRLYGIAFATLIMGYFLLFYKYGMQTERNINYVKYMILFSGLILLFINMLNFDYLIYHYKKAATGQGIDYTYLATLSPDSLSYKDQFDILKEMTVRKEKSLLVYNNKNPYLIIYKIEWLKKKYNKIDIRTISLLEYLQYLQIKNTNTAELKELLPNPYIRID